MPPKTRLGRPSRSKSNDNATNKSGEDNSLENIHEKWKLLTNIVKLFRPEGDEFQVSDQARNPAVMSQIVELSRLFQVEISDEVEVDFLGATNLDGLLAVLEVVKSLENETDVEIVGKFMIKHRVIKREELNSELSPFMTLYAGLDSLFLKVITIKEACSNLLSCNKRINLLTEEFKKKH